MNYEEPKIDVILFRTPDIIRTSNDEPDLGDDNIGDDEENFG